MNNDAMLQRAKEVASKALNEVITDIQPAVKTTTEDMYVVWFCKTLQNWKAMVSTDAVNSFYIEVTHNGDKRETYVDVYRKALNKCYTDEE